MAEATAPTPDQPLTEDELAGLEAIHKKGLLWHIDTARLLASHRLITAERDRLREARTWKPIATVPRDGRPVLLADYAAMCFMALTPHVWAGRYIDDELYECSYAATNENGEATHWAELPEPDEAAIKKCVAPFAALNPESGDGS